MPLMSVMCQSTCMGSFVSSRVIQVLSLSIQSRCLSLGHHLLVRTELFLLAAARRDGQGWPKAIAKRLALDRREHSGRLVGSGEAVSGVRSGVWLPDEDFSVGDWTVPRGARHQARASRHKLVFGQSVRIGTMMQSYASAAKLRGGGPILNRGS